MAIIKFVKISEKYKGVVNTVLQKYPEKGEQLIDFVWGRKKISVGYTLLIGVLALLLQRYILLVLTNKRVLIIELDLLSKPDNFLAFPKEEVKVKKVSSGLFITTIELSLPEKKNIKMTFSRAGGWAEKAKKLVKE